MDLKLEAVLSAEEMELKRAGQKLGKSEKLEKDEQILHMKETDALKSRASSQMDKLLSEERVLNRKRQQAEQELAAEEELLKIQEASLRKDEDRLGQEVALLKRKEVELQLSRERLQRNDADR
eukprot:CAMPEP_0197673918 /NCGR_PEP_ID=MMETSP1338-20131121/81931_1 /TAXON_ID=43686 ORGANISM="Pelagodinium beii, Strain RCC1491" /NCGR_SAMPLE_ID=MMETSP1338 /ASSEMBLY_ACC=CAM_ASM_000754 /LENGTH=122 /DNA_ID=CAMNT_0043254231 /DNA_START=191 /DNA_END=559 /DNA_ORIENTATION=+